MKNIIFFLLLFSMLGTKGYCHKEWLFQLEDSASRAQISVHPYQENKLNFDPSLHEQSLAESFKALFPEEYCEFTKMMGGRRVVRQEKIDPLTDAEKQQFPLLQRLYEPQENERPHPINSTSTLAEQVLWGATQEDLYATIIFFLEDLHTPTTLYLEESKKEFVRKIPTEQWENSIFPEIFKNAKTSQLQWQHQSQSLAEEWRKNLSAKNSTFKENVEEIFRLYEGLESKDSFDLDPIFVTSIEKLHSLKDQGKEIHKVRKVSGKYYNSLLDAPDRTLYAYHKYNLYALREASLKTKKEKQDLARKKEKWLKRAQRDAEYWRFSLLQTEYTAVHDCLCGLRTSFNKLRGFDLDKFSIMEGFF